MSRTLRRRRLLLLVLLGVSASCTPRPSIVTPADGSHVPTPAPGDGVPVVVELGAGFGGGSSFRVTLLTGLDSPPGSLIDVTGAFSEAGGTASGELDPAQLVPGRSTLFVAISSDGDAIAENVVSASFSFEPELVLDGAGVCNPLDPEMCMYPFPSDFYTREDPATDTGRRIEIPMAATPANFLGAQVDTQEWNRNDGWSPGQALQVMVPGIVLARPGADPDDPPIPVAGASPEWDLAASLAHDASIVILEAETGERVPHWAELNSRVPAALGQLLIRPAVNFASGKRYLVALRNLRDESDAILPANRAFQLLRDGIPTYVPEIESRRAHMEEILDALEGHGIPRDDLYLAWDFTVISKRNMSERLIHMRDDAFTKLGDAAPNFVIDAFDPKPGDPEVRYRVRGRIEVPNYLTHRGETGGIDALTRLYCEDAGGTPRRCQGDELPRQARTRCLDEGGAEQPCGGDDVPVDSARYWADFRCTVPSSVVSDDDGSAVPARPSLYGHGLLGSESEGWASHVEAMADEHNFVFCATRWIGMGEDDQITVGAILNEFSRFPTLADRLHQAMINFLYLGRAMIHPEGLGSHPAFQVEGASVIDGTELFYDGNSQGAIAGGALAALAQDFTRAVLGVNGMNYSTLLLRSVDFNQFLVFLEVNYPQATIRPLLFGMAQMLWDRVEANGHANHLTKDTYPETPPKKILLHPAFGDFQVSDMSAEVQARTIGASMHRAGFDPAAYADQNGGVPRPFWPVNPYWNIPGIPDSDPGPAVPGVPNPDYRFDGSAMVVWDAGNRQSPKKNFPPSGGNPELSTCAASFGGDPHECPRRQPLARVQKSEFLKTDGAVLDVCEGTRAGFPATVLDVCLAPLRP